MTAQTATGVNNGIQEAIWSALKRRPLTRTQLSRLTGATGDQISQAINRLRGKGWRIVRDSGRGGPYRLQPSPGAIVPRRRAEIDQEELVAMLRDGEWTSDALAAHFNVARSGLTSAVARLIRRGYPVANLAVCHSDLAIYTIGHARRRFPPGRRCVCCGALLNTYHEGQHCYVHEPEPEEMEVAS
jgi:biotin operon repressor